MVFADRRSYARRPCSVRFAYFYCDHRREGMALDVSRGGAFINTRVFPAVGSELLLEAFHEAAHGTIIRLMVDVRHKRETATVTGVPGIGVQWQRTYCNRGVRTLVEFMRKELGIAISADRFIESFPEDAEGEVVYDFVKHEFRAQALIDDENPLPRAVSAAPADIEPEEHAPSSDGPAANDAPSRGAVAGPRKSRSPSKPVGRAGTSPQEMDFRAGSITKVGPATGEGVMPLQLTPPDDEPAVVRLGLTYSAGNRHFTAETTYVGPCILGLAVDHDAPEPHTPIILRLPLRTVSGYRVIRLEGQVTAVDAPAGQFEVRFSCLEGSKESNALMEFITAAKVRRGPSGAPPV